MYEFDFPQADSASGVNIIDAIFNEIQSKFDFKSNGNFKYLYINTYEYIEIFNFKDLINSSYDHPLFEELSTDDLIEFRFFKFENDSTSNKEENDFIEVRGFQLNNSDSINIRLISIDSTKEKEKVKNQTSDNKDIELSFISEQQILKSHKFKNIKELSIKKESDNKEKRKLHLQGSSADNSSK